MTAFLLATILSVYSEVPYISLQTHGQSKATTTSIVPANSIARKSAMPTTMDMEKILA
jgi:hypothetical protein